jgi:hypothetical protein
MSRHEPRASRRGSHGSPAAPTSKRLTGAGVTGQLVVITPEELEAIIARAVRRALTAAADDGMVSQASSPLGSRRHCNAVKSRLEAGKAGAARIGRRYLLTRDALEEELAAAGASKPTAARAEDPGDKLRRQLGL